MTVFLVAFAVQERVFKEKRLKHYDEFSNVRKARELIAKELADLDKEEEEDLVRFPLHRIIFERLFGAVK